MNLSKALKIKSRLIGELNRARELIRRDNSHTNIPGIETRQQKNIEFQKLVKRSEDLIADIVSIKSAISKANIHIYDKIFYMDELKSLLDYIKTISVEEGETYDFKCGEKVVVNKSVYINQSEVDKMISETQQKINKLQDEIDDYNSGAIIVDIAFKSNILEDNP